MKTTDARTFSSSGSHVWPLAAGFVAGVLAGIIMLAVMMLMRLFLGVATPTEMIFDRVFPLITVDLFINSLVFFNGYTPLKLAGIYGALGGQLFVAGLGGIVYAWFVQRKPGLTAGEPISHDGRARVLDPRGWKLVVPGIIAAWALFVALLWPQLVTHYHGRPTVTAMVISALGMLLSFAVCGVALMAFHGLLSRPPLDRSAALGDAGLARRRFLAGGLGAGAALVLGGVLRRLYQIGTFHYDGTEYLPPIKQITPNDKFYQVTKNLVDPDVARDIWRLEFTGHVENPRTYKFAELTAMPSVRQETTLQCISYRVGGGLISNAFWRGVPLPALLAQVKPKAGAAAVLFHAADGYYETFPFAKAIEPTTLVVWEMNDQPLTPRHGFPVRMVVPGLVGERSAKWVTRLEFIAQDDPRLKMRRHDVEGVGFYTEQGWGPNYLALTTSRFDAPQVTGDHFEEPFEAGQSVELRGMAFGGDKGVGKVEVSVDDGQSWQAATIDQPGSNNLSWSLWVFRWTPQQAGDTQLLVRAADGQGQPQIAENRSPVPQGVTGLHRVRATVEAA